MEKAAGLTAQCDKRVLRRLLTIMQESSKVIIHEVDLPNDSNGNLKKSITVVTDAGCDDVDASRNRCIDRILQKSKSRGMDNEEDIDEFEEAFPLAAKVSRKRKSAVSESQSSLQTERTSQEEEQRPSKRGRASQRRRAETARNKHSERYICLL